MIIQAASNLLSIQPMFRVRDSWIYIESGKGAAPHTLVISTPMLSTTCEKYALMFTSESE